MSSRPYNGSKHDIYPFNSRVAGVTNPIFKNRRMMHLNSSPETTSSQLKYDDDDFDDVLDDDIDDLWKTGQLESSLVRCFELNLTKWQHTEF